MFNIPAKFHVSATYIAVVTERANCEYKCVRLQFFHKYGRFAFYLVVLSNINRKWLENSRIEKISCVSYIGHTIQTCHSCKLHTICLLPYDCSVYWMKTVAYTQNPCRVSCVCAFGVTMSWARATIDAQSVHLKPYVHQSGIAFYRIWAWVQWKMGKVRTSGE